jgi:hypothetical protein
MPERKHAGEAANNLNSGKDVRRLARWGMPNPPQFPGITTNIRKTRSAHTHHGQLTLAFIDADDWRDAVREDRGQGGSCQRCPWRYSVSCRSGTCSRSSSIAPAETILRRARFFGTQVKAVGGQAGFATYVPQVMAIQRSSNELSFR